MKKIAGFICFLIMCIPLSGCAVSDDCVYTTRTVCYPTATVYYRPAPKLGYYYPGQYRYRYHYHYYKPLPPKRHYNKPHKPLPPKKHYNKPNKPTPPSKPHTSQNRRNRH